MKNILQGIGVVFSLIASFLGLMYMLKGDIMVSSLVSLVIVVIEYFLIEKFIKSKSEITKNRFSALSIILWSIYLLLSVPLSIFLTHALNVEINAKKDIQRVANRKIADLDNMVSAFRSAVDKNHATLSIDLTNRLTEYATEKSSRSSELAETLKNKPFNLSEEELILVKSDRENIASTVNDNILARVAKINKTVDSIGARNKNFIKRYGSVFDKWARLQVNYTFYELDNLLSKNQASLIRAYQENMEFAGDSFSYTYTAEETNLTDPIQLFERYNPYYLLVVILLFHILILLPYLIEPVGGTYISQKGPRVGGGIEI